MPGDKTLLTQIDNLSMNEALKIQIEVKKAKLDIAPKAPAQTTITDTKNLNGKTLKELTQKGGNE